MPRRYHGNVSTVYKTVGLQFHHIIESFGVFEFKRDQFHISCTTPILYKCSLSSVINGIESEYVYVLLTFDTKQSDFFVVVCIVGLTVVTLDWHHLNGAWVSRLISVNQNMVLCTLNQLNTADRFAVFYHYQTWGLIDDTLNTK